MVQPIICANCHGLIPPGWPVASYFVAGVWLTMHRFTSMCHNPADDLKPTEEEKLRLHALGVELKD